MPDVKHVPIRFRSGGITSQGLAPGEVAARLTAPQVPSISTPALAKRVAHGVLKNRTIQIRVGGYSIPIHPNSYGYPRRGDELRCHDGRFRVCRVREVEGVHRAVCTNGAVTRFVGLLAIKMGAVEHYRDGIKIN